MRQARTIRPQLALEMTMRDVLGNMEGMASEYGFRDMGGDIEILTIEPAAQPALLTHNSRATHTHEIVSSNVTPLFSPAYRVA